MATEPRAFKSILGRRLGQGGNGQMVVNDIDATPKCVDATITVSAEGATSADQRDITIQLKDAFGDDIDYAEQVMVVLYADAARAAYVATGGSTGIEIGTDGALLALVAKKVFLVTSETDGDIDLTWTDTGTEAAYLALVLPTGRIIMSDALTNA